MAGSHVRGNANSGKKKCGDFFLLAQELLASQEKLCSMELVTLKSTVLTAQDMSN